MCNFGILKRAEALERFCLLCIGEGGVCSAKIGKCLKRDNRCFCNEKSQLPPKKRVERNTTERKVIFIICIRDLLFNIFHLKLLWILRSVLTWFSSCCTKLTSTLQVKICILEIKFANFCAVAKTAFWTTSMLFPWALAWAAQHSRSSLNYHIPYDFSYTNLGLQRSKQSSSLAFQPFQFAVLENVG